jgi:DNA-binding MarR family transcriptional regulator
MNPVTEKIRPAVKPVLPTRKQQVSEPDSGATVPAIGIEQFQKLAEFRFQLRKFLQFSHQAAESRGLRPQQYQLLLCVYGMPSELDPTIAHVAARMLLKHNSAVELVDRTLEQGLLRRCPDPTDHRRILLRVTPQGERLLASLADYHMQELEQAGPELIRALRRVLSIKPNLNSKNKQPHENE